MLTSIIATHGHDGWGYGPGPWFLIFPLLWIALIGFLVWRFRRYARGDISADEYRERLSVLKEDDR